MIVYPIQNSYREIQPKATAGLKLLLKVVIIHFSALQSEGKFIENSI